MPGGWQMDKQNFSEKMISGTFITGTVLAVLGLLLAVFPPAAGSRIALYALLLIGALIVIIGFLAASFVGAGLAALFDFIVMRMALSAPRMIGCALVIGGAALIAKSLLTPADNPEAEDSGFDYRAEPSPDWDLYRDREARSSVRILAMRALDPKRFSVRGIVPGTEVTLSYDSKNRQYYYKIGDNIICSAFGLSDEALYKIYNGEARLFVLEAGNSYLTERNTEMKKKNILIGYYPDASVRS